MSFKLWHTSTTFTKSSTFQSPNGNGMPTEDRGSHEKRQDKKRRNIHQTKYQNWNNRQNTEQTATILWTSESDEERTIPQNSIPRICTWNQKEGNTKEKMDRHDQRGMQ